MSRDTIVAKRYAKALFELAQAQNQIAQVEEELSQVVGIIRDNLDMEKLLTHPNIDTSKKVIFLKQLFEGKVLDIVLSTICLLVERRREELLSALLEDFVIIANEALGQALAIVTTPLALTESEASDIAARFSKISGKKIQVSSIIDPSLLGGLTVRIGDRLYDGSLSGKLARLEKSLQVSQAL
jgi:F-type H+-transporting ATPase subunit delta